MEAVLSRPQEQSRSSEPSIRPKAVVVSHRKDADGVAAAALVRYATGAKIFLTDYSDMIDTLEQIPETSELFICDLGLNDSTFPEFEKQIRRFKKIANVQYIDHHPLRGEFLERLKKLGIEIYHSTEESAAMLVFKKYEEKFSGSPAMKIAACCGAITDYMDLKPFARKTIASFDRQFLLYEATLLAFAIAMIGRSGSESNAHLVKIAEELAEEKLPHEIEGASTYAQEFAAHSAELIDRVRKEGKKMNNFAYFKTKESSTGNVANFLIGAFNVPVGIAFREEEPGYYEISSRGSESSKHDLGKIMSKLSKRFGTSGGGHANAAGARIKESQFEEFVALLDEELSTPV